MTIAGLGGLVVRRGGSLFQGLLCVVAIAYFLPWLFFRAAEIVAFSFFDAIVSVAASVVLGRVFGWVFHPFVACVGATVLVVTVYIDVVSVQTPDPTAFTGRGT
jgi:hypothetical protein